MDLHEELEEKGFLTVNKLAQYLKEHPTHMVSYPTLKRMIERGEIRAYMVGKQVRVSREAIEKFLNNTGEEPSGSSLPRYLQELPPNVEHLPMVRNRDGEKDDY